MRFPLKILSRQRRASRVIQQWEQAGRVMPPPHELKQQVVLEYAHRFRLDLLVETGTYQGRMIEAMVDHFNRIDSIELDKNLFGQAQKKFARHSHIHLHQGDSGVVLASILAELRAPALFWLDGHYSGGITARSTLNTPIMMELENVLAHPVCGHVVLIDDARLFNGSDDYPTLGEIQNTLSAFPSWRFESKDDIIRIHP